MDVPDKEAIQEKDKKLESAVGIHRFNRDIAEALSRIGEKDAILQTEDTGKDTKSAQSHLRKHEGFENDIVALEAQLQVLIDDSAALQSRYPGEDGQHIAQQQQMVLRAWNMFQEKAADRKAALMSSNDYHNFMGMDRNLVFWTVEKSDYLRESIRRCFGSNADHDNLKKPS